MPEQQICWYTYETHPRRNLDGRGSLVKLNDTCRAHGESLPINMGRKPWTGFCAKWIELERRVAQHSGDDIIFVTDARDVLLNRPLDDELREAFATLSEGGRCAVFSSETECCVPPLYYHAPGSFIDRRGRRRNLAVEGDDADYSDDNVTKWLASMRNLRRRRRVSWGGTSLNAGLAVATAKVWKDLLAALKIQKPSEDDQALWTELLLREGPPIRLDYGSRIFYNAPKAPGGGIAFDARAGAYSTGVTEAPSKRRPLPFVIQFPSLDHVPSKLAAYLRMHRRFAGHQKN